MAGVPRDVDRSIEASGVQPEHPGSPELSVATRATQDLNREVAVDITEWIDRLDLLLASTKSSGSVVLVLRKTRPAAALPSVGTSSFGGGRARHAHQRLVDD